MVESLWVRVRAMSGTALATAGLSAALVLGPGAGIAHADALDDLAHEYTTGTGGGQVSSLTRTALQLRSKGAQISESQSESIKTALDKRPNQMPLINTLKSIVASQAQFLKAGQKQKQPVYVGVGPTNGGQIPNGGQMPPNGGPILNGIPGHPLGPSAGGPGVGAGVGGGSIINENIPVG